MNVDAAVSAVDPADELFDLCRSSAYSGTCARDGTRPGRTPLFLATPMTARGSVRTRAGIPLEPNNAEDQLSLAECSIEPCDVIGSRVDLRAGSGQPSRCRTAQRIRGRD